MPDPLPLSETLQSLAKTIAHTIEANPDLRRAIYRTLQSLLHTPEPDKTPLPKPAASAVGTPPPPPVPKRTETVTIAGQQVKVEVPDIDDPEPAPHPHYAPPVYAGPKVVEPAPQYEAAADDGHPIDLAAVARRLRLKADACRVLLGEMDEAAVVAARNRADASTRLWPLELESPAPGDVRDLAGCYSTTADAADLARTVEADPKLEGRLGDALHLLAEAQSSIRDAIEVFPDAPRRDEDQFAVYNWLRDVTHDRRVKIERFMTIAPVAPRGNWPDVQGRVAAAAAPLADRGRRQKALKKVQYHAEKVAKSDADAADGEWDRLYAAVDAAVDAGVPPSDLTLRAALLPLAEEWPEVEPPKNVRLVLDEIDQYRAEHDAAEADAEAVHQRPPSPTLLAARDLLAGRTAVLIGGLPRESHRANLIRALELSDLHWLKVLHHQSLEAAVLPEVRRPEVSVVFVMTRWRSHAVGPAVRKWAKEFGKTLVELPAGYSPEQVAHQVMNQASRELGAAAAS